MSVQVRQSVDWTDFKAAVQSGNLIIQIKRQAAWGYDVFAYNGPNIILETTLDSEANPSDLTDFTDNFLSQSGLSAGATYFTVGESNIKGDDGSNDGVKIGAVGDRLKVDAVATGQAANQIECIDNSYELISSAVKVDLPRANEARATIYSYTGSGKFLGFTTRFNSDRVDLSIIFDGVRVFELNLDDVESANPNPDDNAVGGNFNFASSFFYENSRNIFTFNPRLPICFETSVTIEARADSNSSNRDLLSYWVSIVKES